MKIPGRVGYQCSNFYRQLVRDGEIKDENYEINSDGKLVFRLRSAAGKGTTEKKKRASTSTSKRSKHARVESATAVVEEEKTEEEEEKGEVLPVGEKGRK